MSQTNMPAEAYQKVIDRAYIPVFFEKLSRDWNLQFTTNEDRAMALENAAMLRRRHDDLQAKQAAVGNSFLQEASNQLKTAMSAYGYDVAPPAQQYQVKQAAAKLAVDPETQKAVLELGAWLASDQAA